MALPPMLPLAGCRSPRTSATWLAGSALFPLPSSSYDASVPQRLIIGYAGTSGRERRSPYLALETTAPQPGEIYVYPDLQWHDFEGWGNMGGWLLGPHAYPAHGSGDLAFTRVLIASLSARFCIDPERIFATGHSWGETWRRSSGAS